MKEFLKEMIFDFICITIDMLFNLLCFAFIAALISICVVVVYKIA